ncbi:hypothetical protein [Mesorhizobium sp.]|uniref:hypothetical protein n=1 Tax=Mesorhizobium sp. TaxID=1871066 RepID=UPI000FE75D56|nr:hypothetical protein [Mesorhizobium sp.]RWO08201.1 MAG: hypothetical protein EOS15_29740 [Mesorhizobium sp.]
MNMHVGGSAKFKVGDRVSVLDNMTRSGSPIKEYDVGSVYAIERICGDGEGGDGYLFNGHYQFLRPAQIELAPKFAAGDKVRAINTSIGNDYVAGKTYIVKSYADNHIKTVSDEHGSRRNGWGAQNFEPVYSSCAAAEVDNLADEYGGGRKAKFKVGDRVNWTRVRGKYDGSTIEAIGTGVWPVTIRATNGEFTYAALSELEHVAVAPATATATGTKFKVGDRVLCVKDSYERASGCFGTVAEVGDEHTGVEMDAPFDGHGTSGRRWNFFSSHSTLEPATLRIEAGKFYKTRDGRKVGPAVLTKYPSAKCRWSLGELWLYQDDGTAGNISATTSDLIAEWQDAPVVAEAKFKVGDLVKFRDDYGTDARGKEATVIDVPPSSWGIQVRQVGNRSVSTESPSSLVPILATTMADIVRKHASEGTAIVALIENGQPKPSTLPFVHANRNAAETEATRLAGIHKGQEFGVYELVDVKKVDRTYDQEWQRLAVGGQVIAAIKELRSNTGLYLKTAKDAVEDWLRREAA